MTKYLKNLLTVDLKSFAKTIRASSKLKSYIERKDISLENVHRLVLIYERILLTEQKTLLRFIPDFVTSYVGKNDLLRFLRDPSMLVDKKESLLNSVLSMLNFCKSTFAFDQSLLSSLQRIAEEMRKPQSIKTIREIISAQEKKRREKRNQLLVTIHDKMKRYFKNLLKVDVKSFAITINVSSKLKSYIEREGIPLENVRQLVLIYERVGLTRKNQLFHFIPKFLNSNVGKNDLLRFLRDPNIPRGEKQNLLNSVLSMLHCCKSTFAFNENLLSSLQRIADENPETQLLMAGILSAQEKKKKKILESRKKSLPQAEKKKETKPPKQEAKSPGNKDHLLALDCEMVGLSQNIPALARCSIVDYHGNCVYDEYVKPEEAIADYRTQYSGIEPKHMENALSFEVAQSQIRKIISGKIIVGYTLHHDFKALKLDIGEFKIRDISTSERLRQLGGFGQSQLVSLARLTEALLHRTIQQGGHSSLEDAKATMELYRLVED